MNTEKTILKHEYFFVSFLIKQKRKLINYNLSVLIKSHCNYYTKKDCVREVVNAKILELMVLIIIFMIVCKVEKNIKGIA
jgi:hypothetical protein